MGVFNKQHDCPLAALRSGLLKDQFCKKLIEMNNAIYNFREPKNEPVLTYKPGSQERILLEKELKVQKNQVVDIPLIIGGREIRTGV
jgi:hypothetical protein